MARATDLTIAGLIHDLNNVFQTLIDAADLLSTDPKHEATSNVIFRCVERGKDIMASIVEDVGSCEFASIVTRAVLFTQDFTAATRLEPPRFRVDIDPGLRFHGKASGMERVLVNLFVNSARAMKGGEIRIGARQSSGALEISVADNGPGIAPEVLQTIFEPGVSFTHSSGLGLHIVRSIIEEHRGTVEASNAADGTGAHFLIRLPAEFIASTACA